MSQTPSLASIIDQARVDTIEANVTAAVNDLKKQITANPFLTEFTVYEGCPTVDITREVAFRFSKDGVNVTAGKSMTGHCYLTITRALPEGFVHEEKSEEPKVETKAETKAEETPEAKKTTRVVVKTVKRGSA